jgi:alkylhydroperoxidase family enzyme
MGTHDEYRHADTPRLPPLAEAEWDDVTRSLIEEASNGPANAATNIFRTLIHHPRLLRRWGPFGGVLLSGTLPARERELLILRTAWLCQASYEWGHHVWIGREAGLSRDDIRRVTLGAEAEGWSTLEAALLKATDELHTTSCITDNTWLVLAEAYSPKQLIEVPMVVGQYHLVSFTLNSLGVQPESGLPSLPPS